MTAAAAFSGSRCRARRAAAVQATSSGTGSAAQRHSVVLAQHLGRLAVELGETVPDLGEQLGPAQSVERLFEGLEVIDAEQHGCGAAVLGDHDTLVFSLHLVHHLREVVLDILERHLLIRRHGYKRSYFWIGCHLRNDRYRRGHVRSVPTSCCFWSGGRRRGGRHGDRLARVVSYGPRPWT